ncbi:MAG TPA: ABC transporter permease [Planctomycetaceae bacterium]|nr:ABC transporter permease [Planctomycetaceae bacterium]
MSEPLPPPPFGKLRLVWWLWHLIARLGPLFALLLVIAVFAVADHWKNGENSQFFTAGNARTVSATVATVFVAALGMTVVIIAGGIDLSAGTAQSLSATVLAWGLMRAAFSSSNPWGAIALALGTGALCGLVNGALIGWLRVVPFIVTLGTMRAYLGFGNALAKETTLRPDTATQVPQWLQNWLSVRADALYFGFPLGVWVALVLALLMAGLLRFTVFGRHVFALGSNETAARLCGINVPGMKMAVYSLAGLFFGIAGLYQFSRLSVGQPTSGLGVELKVIAAVVIGGASLNGGRGSILGTLAGAGIMCVIDSGCTQLGLSNPVQDIVLGAVIVSAVAIDQIRQHRMDARI